MTPEQIAEAKKRAEASVIPAAGLTITGLASPLGTWPNDCPWCGWDCGNAAYLKSHMEVRCPNRKP